MVLRKSGLSIALLAFCLLASTGCQVLYTQEEIPSARAPLYFYIAVDNSLSYGLPKGARRTRSTQEVFDAAKNALYRQLLDQGVFQEGDWLVGISPFTDEPIERIENYLTGGPMEIRADNLRSLSTVFLDHFEKIKLRPVSRQGDYRTYYRNVLDKARRDFERLDALASQQVGIVLTDERGSEFGDAAELPPEKYQSYHVIKLEAKATGNGALATTADERLAEFAPQKDAPIATYVEVIRTRHKELHKDTVYRLSWLRLAGLLLLLVALVFGWKAIAKSLNRDWRGRSLAPRLLASFNPADRRIHLRPERFQLPNVPSQYWLDKGGALKNPNPQTGWIETSEALAPGIYNITVQPDKGSPIHGSFTVSSTPKAPPSLKATYNANKNLLFLTARHFPLPRDKNKYELSEDAEIEKLEIESLGTGSITLVQPLRAGRHTLTVHHQEGQTQTTFEANPPPKPQYAVSLTKDSDLGNPKTAELTGREINLLDKENLQTAIWVRKDDIYLYLRVTGNVRNLENDAPLVGVLQYELASVVSQPIYLSLEDVPDDVTITVQQL